MMRRRTVDRIDNVKELSAINAWQHVAQGERHALFTTAMIGCALACRQDTMTKSLNSLGLIALALLLAGCDPATAPQASEATPALLAGWYSQDANQAMLQPCGVDVQLRVVDGAALRDQARTFGLGDGDPVYVIVEGVSQAGRFTLRRVVQLGSPTPMHDCPMTGARIQ